MKKKIKILEAALMIAAEQNCLASGATHKGVRRYAPRVYNKLLDMGAKRVAGKVQLHDLNVRDLTQKEVDTLAKGLGLEPIRK